MTADNDPQARMIPLNLRRLKSLLGEHVFVAASPIVAEDEDLLPAEAAEMSDAVLKRRREFATGRVLARSLLTAFGHRGPLTRRADRTPSWPDEVIGSITHSDRLCVVTIAPRAFVASIGIDIEPATTLPKGLWSAVLTPEEIDWISAATQTYHGLIAKAVFCCKEAAYKCQYSTTGKFLEFHDVNISFVSEHFHFTGDFLAKLKTPTLEFELQGFVTIFARHFLAGIVVPERDICCRRVGGDG